MTDKHQKQNPVSRDWLESLIMGELIKVADDYGVDIPAGLDRDVIIEEIMESFNAEKDSEEKTDIAVNPSYSEAVLLPKQYNISYIEVIIRDPLWAFVFWEIKGYDKEIYESAADFNGYCLRVIPINEGDTEQQARENSFTVSIAPSDSARYLGFMEHTSKNSGRYVIKLNVLRGETETQIASTLPFDLPKLYEAENITEKSLNPLIHLSGILDLSITMNTDRQPRAKRPS